MIKQAEILRVVDGDTMDIIIQVGVNLYEKHRVRLARIDCPERFTDEGKKATQFCNEWFLKNTTFTVELHETGKYGRFISDIYTDKSDLVLDLISAGHIKS